MITYSRTVYVISLFVVCPEFLIPEEKNNKIQTVDLNMENNERIGAQSGEKSMTLPFSIRGILGLETVSQVLGETNSQSITSGSSGINEISGSKSSDTEKEDTQEGDPTFLNIFVILNYQFNVRA